MSPFIPVLWSVSVQTRALQALACGPHGELTLSPGSSPDRVRGRDPGPFLPAVHRLRGALRLAGPPPALRRTVAQEK